MSLAFRHFHPNPGWTTAEQTMPAQTQGTGPAPESLPPNKAGEHTNTVGKHCILELYNCDRRKLDDERFIRSAMRNAAVRAGATLLQLISHRFEPQGITSLALLAESHISIHTWPESGYAAVDVFTCGDHTMPESACRVLIEELRAGSHQLRSFRRATPSAIAASDRRPALELEGPGTDLKS